jgi:NitT/TauT family transport system permease protein
MQDQLTETMGAPAARPAPGGRSRRGGRLTRTHLLQIGLILGTFAVVLLFLQYGLSHTGVKSYVVPKPSTVVSSLNEYWGSDLGPALWFTAREIVFGLLLGIAFGVALAILIDALPVLEFVILPYVVALVMTPMIALVPVVFLQFGDTLVVRIFVVAFAAAPMMMLNTLTGLRRTPAIRLDVMRALRAGRVQTLWKVKLPSALPMMFTGLLIGAIFAVIAGVGTEFVSSNDGLGAKIVYYSSLAQTGVVYAAIMLLVILGLVLYGTITVLERRFAGWRD